MGLFCENSSRFSQKHSVTDAWLSSKNNSEFTKKLGKWSFLPSLVQKDRKLCSLYYQMFTMLLERDRNFKCFKEYKKKKKQKKTW